MNEKLSIIIAANVADLKKGCKEAVNAIDDIDKEGAETSKNSEGHFSKMGDAAKKAGSAIAKGLAVGMAAAATGVVALTKKAIEGFAEYEQLIGGVETLFKDSANIVEGYANQAYKTAGLSANAYMETVTGFSASMLQSLGGDTKKAAELSNQAVIDMADNANKMGTSMESIQNAYAGFAKQNYTMLDNLKLGYGGTKEEMQRLLTDAEKITGIKYDISNFADVTEAIHVMQTEIGITGTTANEAASTISGSTQMMKASWDNLIVGIADDNADFDSLINNFVESASTAMDNILPRVEVALNGVAQLIEKLLPKLMELIPPLITNVLPKILNAAVQVVQALIQGIVQAFPSLIQTISDLLPQVITMLAELIPQITSALLNALPLLIETLFQLAGQIMTSLGEIIPQVINQIVEVIPLVVTALVENIPILIDGAISLITSLLENITSILEPLITALPDIIIAILDGLLSNLPLLINGVITLVLGIVAAIPQIIQSLIDALPTIISMLIESLLSLVPQLIVGLIQVVWGVTKALPQIFKSLLEGVVNIFKGIWDGISKVFSKVGTWFKDKFQDAFNNVKNVFSKLTGFFSGIWDSIKNIFSKVGATIGNAITNTVKSAINGVLSTAIKIINGFISAINIAISVINAIPGVSISKINKLSVPKLAKGGIVDSATLAVVGEQGKEAVMPLENNTEWIGILADALASKIGGNTPIVLEVDGRVFAQTSIKTINDLTRQTGKLQLQLV